jgi:hypothetical protein
MTPDRRAKCRQTRYPDPKLSTVHETGASPKPYQVRQLRDMIEEFGLRLEE